MDLEDTDKIFGQYAYKPFSAKRWFKKNLQGILGTMIFHMFLLILFLSLKIQSFKEVPEHRITLDFSEMEEEERRAAEEKLRLTQAEAEYLERLLAQQLNISNRASNIGKNLEEELSTKNYVDRVEQELDKTRTEEWRRQQEEIQKKLNQQDYVPEEKQPVEEPDIDDYKGLTNISYEFLEPPLNRYKIYLPVPVYKCQGEGIVQVEITVDQTGRVLSSKANVQQDIPDKNCMIEIAERYSKMTRFQGMLSAPRSQKAKIIYRFVRQ